MLYPRWSVNIGCRWSLCFSRHPLWLFQSCHGKVACAQETRGSGFFYLSNIFLNSRRFRSGRWWDNRGSLLQSARIYENKRSRPFSSPRDDLVVMWVCHTHFSLRMGGACIDIPNLQEGLPTNHHRRELTSTSACQRQQSVAVGVLLLSSSKYTNKDNTYPQYALQPFHPRATSQGLRVRGIRGC